MTELFIPMAVAFLLSLVLVRMLALQRLSGWALDRPNERSLHAVPVPRSGGVGLLAGAGMSWGLFASGAYWPLVLLAGFLMLPSLIDDVVDLPVLTRFVAQTTAAIAVVALYPLPLAPVPALALAPVFVLGILWLTNLYNFMDGSDGMAGGMAVLGFGGLACAAHLSGAMDVAVMCGVVAAAAAAFLIWNFSPAIIFMGDSGSVPLGFLAAALGVVGWQRGIWPLGVPVLMFAPFIVDATVTLARRLARGENVTQAHRQHTYQKLIRSGWTHGHTALAAYGLMAASAAVGVLARGASDLVSIGIAGAVCVALALLFLIVERRFARLIPDQGAAAVAPHRANST